MATSPYEVSQNEIPGPYDYSQDSGVDFAGLNMEVRRDIVENPYDLEGVLGQVRPFAAEAIHVLEVTPWNQDASSRGDFIKQEVPGVTPRGQFAHDLLSLYEQSTEETTLREFAYEVYQKHNLRNDPALFEHVEYLHDRRAKTETLAAKITGGIERVIEGDDTGASAYVAAKLLAAHPGAIIDDLEAIVVQDLVAVGAEFEATDLYEELEARVRQGDFDQHIAKDLLYQVAFANGEDKSKYTSALRGFIDMAKYLMQVDDDPTAISRLTAEQGLSLWSQDPRRALEAARKNLADTMQRRSGNRREFAYATGIILRNASSITVEQFATKHPTYCNGTARGSSFTRAEAAALNVRRRRAAKSGVVGKIAVNDAETTGHEVDLTQTRELHCVNTRGEVFDDQSEEFKTMIKDYLSEHPDEEGKLKNALNNAFEYLRNPVRTNGYVRGIQPLRGSLIRFPGDPRGHKVYRFRPNQGTGVPVSCKTAQKMRILFVVDKDNSSRLNIIGISDKDALPKLCRKFGASNGKNK